MIPKVIAQTLLCFTAVVIATQPSFASSTSYAIDPAATKALNQMQSAYTALNSLCEQVIGSESPDLPHSILLHTSIKILRPAYLSVISDSKSSRSGATAVVMDGSHCYCTEPQYPTRYLKFSITNSAQSLCLSLSHGITSAMTIAMFAAPTSVSTMFSDQRLATLQLAKSTKIDGVPMTVIVATDTDGVTITLFLGKTDHLVRRIIAIDPNKSGDFTETYTNIHPNAPLTPADFVFTPPPHLDPFYGTSFNQAIQDAPN